MEDKFNELYEFLEKLKSAMIDCPDDYIIQLEDLIDDVQKEYDKVESEIARIGQDELYEQQRQYYDSVR